MRKKVKFIAVLSLVMAVATSCAFAQKFHYGVKASATFNNIIMDSISGSDTTIFGTDGNPLQFGYNVGAFVEYMVTSKIGVSAELLYSRQGRKEVKKDDFGTITTNVTTSNINLPIMLKIYLSERLAVEAGPQFGYCFGGKVNMKTAFNDEALKDSELSLSFKELEDEDNNRGVGDKDFKYWNRFGIALGLGASINFKFGLFVGARYTIGVTDLLNTRDIQGKQVTRDSKCSEISISAGFRF